MEMQNPNAQNSQYSPEVEQIFADIKPESIANITEKCSLLVQTDMMGNIQYANECFLKHYNLGVSCIGHNITVLDHPAMPKSLITLCIERVKNDDDTNIVFINKSLQGNVICVYTEVDIIKDRYGEYIHTFSRRKGVPLDNLFEFVIPFYKFLVEKERQIGVEATVDYLKKFMKENNFNSVNDLTDYLAYNK